MVIPRDLLVRWQSLSQVCVKLGDDELFLENIPDFCFIKLLNAQLINQYFRPFYHKLHNFHSSQQNVNSICKEYISDVKLSELAILLKINSKMIYNTCPAFMERALACILRIV